MITQSFNLLPMPLLIKEINSGKFLKSIPDNGIAELTETVDEAESFNSSVQAFDAGNKIVIQEGQEFWVVDPESKIGGGLIGIIEGAQTGGGGTAHPPLP